MWQSWRSDSTPSPLSYNSAVFCLSVSISVIAEAFFKHDCSKVFAITQEKSLSSQAGIEELWRDFMHTSLFKDDFLHRDLSMAHKNAQDSSAKLPFKLCGRDYLSFCFIMSHSQFCVTSWWIMWMRVAASGIQSASWCVGSDNQTMLSKHELWLASSNRQCFSTF